MKKPKSQLDHIIQEQLNDLKSKKVKPEEKNSHYFIKIFGGLIFLVVVVNLLLNIF
ncbi:hypothetical protein [Ignavigranum ruoffiae]|uniref:hypothetical protein n=1 Tax=Ignavigranum ruoffiae TaxID=89093 RepID=UPI0024AD29E3|nr:hypothetical protein [Ignavigranum ruoffiae]